MEALIQQRQQQEERARAVLYEAKAVGGEHSRAPPRPDYEARRAVFMASQA